MKYKDLENDGLPIDLRVKHLEKEASFVRDYVKDNNAYRTVAMIFSFLTFALSLIAVLK
jgi:hypothetical protein